MRSIIFPVLCLWSGLACAAGVEPVAAAAASKLQCEAQTPGGDLRSITCPLNAAAAPRRLRFKVDFSGGHDDTMASMTLSLDGQALACEPGSKTQLMGEDGDVSLECRFSVPAGADTRRVLRASVKWSHAQYTDFDLAALE
jgi:hypothetical protein